MASSPRRSGRSRKANTKYANDGWGKETLRLLRESSESSNPTSVDTDEESLQNDDEEFEEVENNAPSAEVNADEDNPSVASDSSQSSQVATPRNADEDEDDMSIAASEDGGSKTKRLQWRRPTQAHSRGISNVERGRSVKGGVWQLMFGPEFEDLYPVLRGKDRWLFNLRDATLPSWITISGARRKDWISNELDKPIGASHHGLSDEIIREQRIRRISLEEAKKRYFVVDGIDHRIVLGPWSKQRAYDLPFLKPISLGQAWKVHSAVSEFSYHCGWLFNIAEKPQCMAWAPNQSQDQYLALTCRSTPKQRSAAPKAETKLSPAFAPSSLYPSSIQIWEFTTQGHSDGGKRIDFTTPPQLIQILACSYGDIKQAAWAPEPQSTAQKREQEQIGILTIITTDGHVRLIQVPKTSPSCSEPICIEVLSPILTLSPPRDAIFTSFAFASPVDLILGTSSGHVHIYNLSQTHSQEKPEPYFNQQLHHTYILSLSTTDEANNSHYLASVSAAGTIQLTDLRSPTQDTLTVPRARLPTRNLIFNPHSRSFITTIDSSGNTEPRGTAQTTIASHNLRHFYSATALSKYPEGGGTATTLAGSPLHPCVLMGNSGGTVWAQNVIRRIFPTGKPGAKNDAGAWVQKVIEYEWISSPSSSSTTPPTSSSSQSPSTSSPLYHGSPTRPGTSRMHHGFKPEKLDLSNQGSKKRKAVADGDTAIQVIFEEEQAVTAMAWNGNPVAASWCSIGWASGVMLVADLGHATK